MIERGTFYSEMTNMFTPVSSNFMLLLHIIEWTVVLLGNHKQSMVKLSLLLEEELFVIIIIVFVIIMVAEVPQN